MPRSPSFVLAAAALLGLLFIPLNARADQSTTGGSLPSSVDAQFRGCDSAGWCRFWIDSADPAQSLYRVRPDGVLRMSGGDAVSIAVRNRLNALLSDMIHQAKHIVLHDLRTLDDGTFAATVTITGIDLASDPVLLQLRGKAGATSR